ncbi:MAG: 50S ribosomal protein L22 [Candidatus Bathyarchaeia archaeon]
MPEWKYSIKELDPARTVKCSGRELRISPKAATEICRSIKGMKLTEAKELLEDVIAKKRAIAYRKYKKEAPHRKLQEKWYTGRYPVKAAKKILKLLEELEANAEYKGLDTERLKIIHAASQRGMKIKKYIPRAFGRSSPYFETLTHVELVGYEVE